MSKHSKHEMRVYLVKVKFEKQQSQIDEMSHPPFSIPLFALAYTRLSMLFHANAPDEAPEY